MKKIIIDPRPGFYQFKMLDGEMPQPKATEVQVRWKASSLNYHDFLVASGGLQTEAGRIPMSDGAGVITAIGSEVKEWRVGDKVMSMFFPTWQYGKPSRSRTTAIAGETADGFAAEYTCVQQTALTLMPEQYSYAEAATLPCAALTAWRALIVEGNLKAGESVLIEGTGGMSIFALQLAKMSGAEVYATTGNAAKMSALKKLGAAEVFNYKEDKKWGKSVYKHTKGGVDHVLDVGGSSTMQQSIEAVKIYGNIYSIGLLGGPKGEIVFPKLFFKQIHLTGLAVGNAQMQREMVNAFNANPHIRPVINKTFAFDDLAEAFDYQKKGQHFGKIVVEW